MATSTSVKLDAIQVAVEVLLGLGAMLKLYCQRATSVLPSRVCYLAHLGLHLYSKRQLRKNHNFGTATS